MKNIFLHNRFYIALGIIALLFVVSYSFLFLYPIVWGAIGLLVIIITLDSYLLYNSHNKVVVRREVGKKISLSETHKISYSLEKDSDNPLDIEMYDELPQQLQHRTFLKKIQLSEKPYTFDFQIRPYERGIYAFGDIHLYLSNPKINLLQRKVTLAMSREVQVVPSVKQMKKYELQVFSKTARLSGIRQIRQIGENDEFEHIRPYTQGDNVKAINWKATSRKNQLMVNQYQNSRHQSVYCIVDKGRSMKMPFNGLTLLDHAINSTLTLSNIILKKYDHAGLLTFSDKIGTMITASAKKGQLEKISDALYNQKTGFKESNFELLSQVAVRQINRRSIWLFYTNFETPYDLKRHLPHLCYMSKRHLIVVIIFINTELIETSEMECETKSDIYKKTFAQKALLEKELIKEALIKNGIQTILTRPEKLSVNVINKYLELKAKRMR